MKKIILASVLVIPFAMGVAHADHETRTNAGGSTGGALKNKLHAYRYYKPLYGTSSTPRAGEFVPYDYGFDRCYTKQGKHLSNKEEKEDILCYDNRDGKFQEANVMNFPGRHDPADFGEAFAYAKVGHRRLSWKNRLRDALKIVNPYVYHESILPESIKPHDKKYSQEEGRHESQEKPNSLDGDVSGKSKLFRLRNVMKVR